MLWVNTGKVSNGSMWSSSANYNVWRWVLPQDTGRSGLASYNIAINESNKGWLEVTSGMIDKTTYLSNAPIFAKIKFSDKAGNISGEKNSSYPLKIDTEAPLIDLSVADIRELNGMVNDVWQTSTRSVIFSWEQANKNAASDALSGVVALEYYWGPEADKTSGFAINTFDKKVTPVGQMPAGATIFLQMDAGQWELRRWRRCIYRNTTTW